MRREAEMWWCSFYLMRPPIMFGNYESVKIDDGTFEALLRCDDSLARNKNRMICKLTSGTRKIDLVFNLSKSPISNQGNKL